jgi:hypothetical protein
VSTLLLSRWLTSARLQDYEHGVTFELWTRRTAQILYLNVANVTYIPRSKLTSKLRPQELRVVERSTPACLSSAEGLCLHSSCILNRHATLCT